MTTMRRIVHPRLVRNVAFFWIIIGLLGAYVQAAHAWTALTTGQTRLPLGTAGTLVRTADPLGFHLALLASLLIALACLYAAYGAWRLRQALRSSAAQAAH